jgi:hypothetical protein
MKRLWINEINEDNLDTESGETHYVYVACNKNAYCPHNKVCLTSVMNASVPYRLLSRQQVFKPMRIQIPALLNVVDSE